MIDNIRPTWAEIDLDNLEHNMKEIAKLCKGKEIIAVLKADAYGHGALDVARTLINGGATKLGVAVITEALELRDSGIDTPIVILGYTPLSFAKELIRNDIEQTVYTYECAAELSKEAQSLNKRVKIHVAVDTGMGRIGFLPTNQGLNEIEALSKLPNVDIDAIFTHFATADEADKSYTLEQMEKFNWFCDALEKRGVNVGKKHIANSAAIIDMPDAYFDGVRPGILLYGYYPSYEVNREKLDLKRVLTLKANISYVKTLPKGEYISYGRKFYTERESIIATIPIGYADGYSRQMLNKAKVIINGQLAPVVGSICMDQCMVDVTDIGQVKEGDEVILLGEQNGVKFDAEDMAEIIGTISYEVICMISKRVPRVYIRDGEIVKVRNYV
ncbi:MULTISPECIES: alanine racemase [Clostridium]|uniref:Alanine racemase n=1 Tax=Clostridium cadaveris TaxID=1529 RepID=A0A1I2K6D3_9CLOT|nr:alanine racemase [Clostridium cadaveris]MDU4952737.1 alanine racemase [Clostridium sp.]MDM8312197.1 alanine racemase [Clostridium cadaveris]MDY4948272.1 alanine racemase [Clostridium cadaveris]NME64023.1 alanine racemase [Clostridium cadaveris]NWK12164.1 alanine racemase [Clostridium cadaveris]